ncbi:Receptor like protein 42 [Vitis vinifera]|uniref:Receptor like protein 42 n=1 Tax=Vitis vinifera TaxID=29760 RepID=A0A438ENG2_VITVI|nr:Receptor like protein 42 [Vitis vinifera]
MYLQYERWRSDLEFRTVIREKEEKREKCRFFSSCPDSSNVRSRFVRGPIELKFEGEGSFSFTPLLNNSQLVVFDLVNYNKTLKVEIENPTWFPPFHLEVFRLSNCSLSTPTKAVPSFLLNQHELQMLDLSHSGMTGKVPTWLLVNNTALEFLSIGSNILTVLLICNLTRPISTWFYLISPPISSTERFHLTSVLSSEFACLNMSGNALQGYIPPSVDKMEELRSLDLSFNNFSGPLPRSLFMGEISEGLLESSSLELLDISNNSFSGVIPDWIGNFSLLTSLVLSRNSLEDYHIGRKGAREDKFGNVDYVWAANLSLSTYSYEEELSRFRFLFGVGDAESDEGDVVEFISKSRSESYAGSILHFMSGMDLSDNKLTGPIPREMGYLSGIHTINLSHNHFSGPIPETFSNLKEVESLDISYNELTGKTPEMKFQFMTFDQSIMRENPLLCGLPLERSCTPTGPPPATPPTSEKEEIGLWKAIFLWSFVGSYGVAFLGIAAFLYLSSYYRELLFDFIEAHVSFLRLRTW